MKAQAGISRDSGRKQKPEGHSAGWMTTTQLKGKKNRDLQKGTMSWGNEEGKRKTTVHGRGGKRRAKTRQQRRPVKGLGRKKKKTTETSK